MSLFCASILGAYFVCLVGFSFVSSPLGYCVFLVVGSLCLSLATIVMWGFSWYLALFVLVYVGGVYVLFLFVSVHSANPSPVVGGSLLFYALLWAFFFFLSFLFIDCHTLIEESSRFLCSMEEGVSYLVLCFTLLLGFIGVSCVSSQKDSFFR